MSEEPSLSPSFREHHEHDGLQDDNSMRVVLPVTLAIGGIFSVILTIYCCNKPLISGEVNEILLN